MPKIGILTTVDANHGSSIFNSSIYRLIQNINNQNDVHILNTPNLDYQINEFLRTIKFNFRIPFYNLRRMLSISQYANKETKVIQIHSLPNNDILCEKLNSLHYSALITAKIMWNITEETSASIPNIYWLPEKIKARKIAYAISGHLSDLNSIKNKKEMIYSTLSRFQLIGVRDKITQIMMEETGVDKSVPVYRISDPAFLYSYKKIDLNTLLIKYKISTSRPILGLLYYGKADLTKKICSHYHKRGYQIINFNMFNPFADINIGHLVDPDEWAALFNILSFCITDRFHASVFCIKENVPFISIDPFKPKTILNSKIFNLLEEFELIDTCYQDIYDENFNYRKLIDKCCVLESSWKNDISEKVRARLTIQKENQFIFLALVQQAINT